MLAVLVVLVVWEVGFACTGLRIRRHRCSPAKNTRVFCKTSLSSSCACLDREAFIKRNVIKTGGFRTSSPRLQPSSHVFVSLLHLASGGGGLHCSSHTSLQKRLAIQLFLCLLRARLGKYCVFQYKIVQKRRFRTQRWRPQSHPAPLRK